jgi:TnpA family transposase
MAPIWVYPAWPMRRVLLATTICSMSRNGTSATTTTSLPVAIINAHHSHPMAALWGDGTTSSSDGQYFRAGGRAGPGGAINSKYGIDPGAVLYTHVSGQYANTGRSIRRCSPRQ